MSHTFRRKHSTVTLLLVSGLLAVLGTACKSSQDESGASDDAPAATLEAEVASYYLGAGDAVMAALTGESYDTERYGTQLQERVTDLAKAEFAKFGADPKIILVKVPELQAGQVTKQTGGKLATANMWVLQSGELRYGFITFDGEGYGSYRDDAVDTPRGKAIRHLLSTYDDCSVPLMTESDAAGIPPWVWESTMAMPPRSDAKLQEGRDFACKQREKASGELGPSRSGGSVVFYVKGSDAEGTVRVDIEGNPESERWGVRVRKAGCTRDTEDECEKGTSPVERVVSVRSE